MKIKLLFPHDDNHLRHFSFGCSRSMADERRRAFRRRRRRRRRRWLSHFLLLFFFLTGANKMPTLTQHVNLILSTMLLLLLLFPFIFSSRGETSDARRRKRMEEKKGTLIQNHKTKRSYKNMRKEKKAVISWESPNDRCATIIIRSGQAQGRTCIYYPHHYHIIIIIISGRRVAMGGGRSWVGY